jgi:hypothetical protein
MTTVWLSNTASPTDAIGRDTPISAADHSRQISRRNHA